MSHLEELYDELFTPKHLIKYGYFSYKKNRDIQTDNEDYFSAETFYRMFNLNSFSDIAIPTLNSIITQPFDTIATEPIYFNVAKKDLVRRQYKLPNLYSYTNLVKFMCENKEQFVDVFLNNKFSTSKFFDSPKYKYAVTEEIKSKLLFSGNKLLHLDLSNFYHALYTHSIPWILMGKQAAKANRSQGFANDLDNLIEACQDGETHGIPTGNLASRIVAELFMCHFDKKLENNNYKYVRYVDDFTFSFTVEYEKEKFMEQINLICREYNLYLNSEKTFIEEFPQNNDRSKSKIFNFFNNYNFLNKNIQQQRELISSYLDLCLTEESKGNKGALKIIFSGLQRNIVYSGNFSDKEIDDLFLFVDKKTETSLLEKIFDISIKKPELTNRFMDLFEDLFTANDVIRKKAKRIIQKYIDENQSSLMKKLEFSKENNFSQEFYQILLYLVQFNVNTRRVLTKKSILSFMDNKTDDFSLCLLVIIYIKRKLAVNDLLYKVNKLLEETSESFPNKSRFSRKLWYFRYFIYYLIKNNIIEDRQVKRFHNTKNFPKNQNGYISELNSRYIFTQGNQGDITRFYKKLLDLNVSLVDCGSNNSFKYF